ncbi:hypothetical protein DQ384_17410 [Sphaerisporangium album]|uniref:Secreted protein n=2 Tax=Sphaerisporangium album TaxID=509200 RepID=A0A367FHY9_9ACTN|nr:hypothetical protein DQ384_17410 [Sphaerisporangium album]
MLVSAVTAAAVCALGPAGAASAAAGSAVHMNTGSPVPTDTGSPVHIAGADDPPPEEQPCPGGEPKPCGAPAEERGSVESGRADAKKAGEDAKKDIAAAKDKAEKCAPDSTEAKGCMTNLIGDGADQQKGLDDTKRALSEFKPAPSDNAATAVAGTCDAFAADLAPLFQGDPALLTGICELMK